ncbi:MAG TPA: chemotaxis protein CheA [Myxococcales bacterium]|nr:chemotaxis protein CheA [Myxococcales bacterium]
MDEVVTEFLVESAEMLDQMEREMVALEAGRAGPNAIRTIFRAIHTIKGTAGFLGMQRLQSATHAGENLLSELRDGKLNMSPAIGSALLALVDYVRRTLKIIEGTGKEGEDDVQPLIGRLNGLFQPGAPAPAAPPPAVPVPAAVVAAPAPAAAPAPIPVPAAPAAPPPEAPLEPVEDNAASASTIRVGVNLLDKLMTLVGELVLVRNQVLQQAGDGAFGAASQRLNGLTTELQEGVMKARMQSIGNVMGKLPRVVRDLAQSTGKQVRLEMEGNETELDKTILEAIKDPLLHLVRNACDHGVEMPDERVKRGKPAEGRLHIRSFHEGGRVNIEVSDDGKGIDLERVRRKAVERGIMAQDQAARAGERELHALIFAAGFSTAEKVTAVSGRGVGLDVVKTNVEKIGGTLDVSSSPQGTTFRIKIPLTLAIIPVLVVRSVGERYAIPQNSLLEVVRVEADKIARSIETIHGSQVYRLRGALLPLVDMRQALTEHGLAAPAQAAEAVNIVVLQAEQRQFGLLVDEIVDTQEIVVKPLDPGLKHISIFAGSTIMGDGRVALIIDVGGVAQRARVLSDDEEAAAREAAAAAAKKESHRLLLLEAADQGRMAIPLAEVERLEELQSAAVETAGDGEFIQYRGHIMPLVRLSQALAERRSGDRVVRAEPAETMHVVVFRRAGQDVGLVVDRILDVVEDPLDVRRPPSRRGVLYCAVIGNRITELLDVPAIVSQADVPPVAAVGS